MVSSDEIFDDIGPSIELYMNDKQFVSGGITNSTPTFLAFIEDSSGINTIGNSIGHDITITIDGDYSKKIILNDYYQAEKDSYQKGKVEYSLKFISRVSYNNLKFGMFLITLLNLQSIFLFRNRRFYY